MVFLRLILWITLIQGLIFTPLQAQEKSPVRATLLSDSSVIKAGEPFYVGLYLQHAKGWHTYWQYSGDSGLPTEIEWELPPGFVAGPILWPVPKHFVEQGDLHAYAYEGDLLLLTQITPPADLSEHTDITIQAKAKWLMCKELCIPGNADLSLHLTGGKTVVASPQSRLFIEWLGHLPNTAGMPYPFTWKKENHALLLELQNIPASATIDFFPLPEKTLSIGHPVIETLDTLHTVRIPLIENTDVESIPGVLVVTGTSGDSAGWQIAGATTAAGIDSTLVSIAPPQPTGTLWKFLLYGFLGGLILNVMPCVLPVISLKVFGFIRQADEEPKRIFRMGLVFTAGIFTWFLGLATLIAGMKILGREVTWAFQFQNPWFIVTIATLVFVFALNLFGVFEIVLPGKAGQAIAQAEQREGTGGVFFQGIFATILATPCTAPFLGTALGFAFSQSTMIIFLIFAAIALGMSTPYLLLTARPAWMRFLPRPGIWMVHVKQFMGFLLLATLLWLLWILGYQGGMASVIWMSAFLLLVAIACWVYGTFLQGITKPKIKWGFGIATLILLVIGSYQFLGKNFTDALTVATRGKTFTGDSIDWEEFSETRLQQALGGDRIVFVDFTAEWCLTCKFNKRTALETEKVGAWIASNNVLAFKADWTNADPEITRALAKFGRVGVPFYTIYPAGKKTDPIILPELLTENIVLDAFNKAKLQSKTAGL